MKDSYTYHYTGITCLIHICISSVSQAENYLSTGQWDIASRDNHKVNGTETTQAFDGVMICTGHHAHTKMPTFDGMDEFKGEIMHSHDYKDCSGLKGKRVVVVGFGNSGADCMMDASQIASQVSEIN